MGDFLEVKTGTDLDKREKKVDQLDDSLEDEFLFEVAMSKVVWLEEHRATRQAAIDNAVRLAQAELKMKLEEELESKLEARIEEAKIQWQSDNMRELNEERQSWESVKREEIEGIVEEEKNKWRNTELVEKLESEHRKLACELEQEKESWREFELETEKLKWSSEFEQKLSLEKESWEKTVLEPLKMKLKQDFEEKLQVEKENWRCVELETEKLTLLREYEKRLAEEKQAWIRKTLPETLEAEKHIWKTELEKKLKREHEEDLVKESEKIREKCRKDYDIELEKHKAHWEDVELPRELEKAREKWISEMETRLREEKKNWKNCDLPEEIEKERKKWMKLMEQTLMKERDNWKKRDLPVELERVKQGLESEMESRLVQQLTLEKDKLQKESELKVLEAIEEHQEACKKELLTAIDIEKERLKLKFESDLKEHFNAEKKVWREMVDQELLEKLEIEKEKWKLKSESEFSKRIMSETEKITAEMEKKMEEEKKDIREQLEEELDHQMKVELDKINEKFKQEAREDFEHMKAKFDRENREECEQLKHQIEHEMQMNLDKEKELMQVKADREVSRRVEFEKEQWKSEFEKEMAERLQNEECKWKEIIDKDIDKRLNEARDVWEKEKEILFEKKLQESKKKLKEELDKEKTSELQQLTEKIEENMKNELDQDMERFKAEVEQEFHQRVEHEVNLAVQEAREDWNREYLMEMSINTTSAEASQGLLREEIENLKHQLDSAHTELLEKEKAWLKQKEDLLLQKDLERRRDLDKLQDQTEAEYKQFIEEHKDTLDKALKAARQQHNKDKNELEERYNNQMKLLQAREKSLQGQLQHALEGTQEHDANLLEYEKERLIWLEERDRLLQDIADRDSLLGKADVHLSKEVDKLRTELQAAYQRRLEGEVNTWRQKLEVEFTRANNSEQKEKLQLEKQLSEVNTELNKLKALQKEERAKYLEEGKSMNEKLNSLEKQLYDYSRLEGELKKAKELLKGYKEELTDNQQKCDKLRVENEELTAKLKKSVQNQEKLQIEIQKMKEEKNVSMETMESSFRKDVLTYKQKLEEANSRIAKSDKLLQDMKHKYRTELESLRKALEAENDVAMNAMKNKMIELQKKHAAIVEELRRKHQLEKEELTKHGHTSSGRMVTPTPNMGEVEEIDATVKELRTQYLDTVAKIKDDVLRHITQTNVRAAETVKLEMDKERLTTFQQIKDFYRQNVKTILETEIVGATLESKLLAVEEALNNLSSNPSSRSATPKSDEFILDERQIKSRSRSASRDAGISPKGQRTVSFTSGTKGERSRTPGGLDDLRGSNNRLFTRSPHEMHITLRGELGSNQQDFRDFDTRNRDSRPTSAKSLQDLRDRSYDTRASENRPLSAKSPRELHLSLRQRAAELENDTSVMDKSRHGDKRRSRTLISTRDIHSGRYTKSGEGSDGAPDLDTSTVSYHGDQRAKSVTPMYSSLSRSSPSLYRPTSVPDLSSEDKELKVWTETNNDTYRYTPLRETLRPSTNLHRSNSKSESDLSIADKSFGALKPEYDSNLDLSTGSLHSDLFMTPRQARDAGETPTSTPRRQPHRKHHTLHSFPTSDQINSELRKRDQTENIGGNLLNSKNISRFDSNDSNSPITNRSSRKNLPLIQFRHGKVQGLTRMPGTSSKSPHPEEAVMVRDTPPTRDTTGTPERHYRPLSVSSTTHMNF